VKSVRRSNRWCRFSSVAAGQSFTDTASPIGWDSCGIRDEKASAELWQKSNSVFSQWRQRGYQRHALYAIEKWQQRMAGYLRMPRQNLRFQTNEKLSAKCSCMTTQRTALSQHHRPSGPPFPLCAGSIRAPQTIVLQLRLGPDCARETECETESAAKRRFETWPGLQRRYTTRRSQ
jgi:hypothetical protein